ncbi:hypothetical protein ID866_2764 [Astraeus odoratus]|nr:hypothetical protein ID866_2764 [Astraeus odoratus]
MEFHIRNLDTKASKYTVTKAIADVLHVCPGPFVTDPEQRPPNFDVTLHESECGGVRNKGTGTFTVTKTVGKQFDRLYHHGEISVVVEGRELRFRRTTNTVKRYLCLTLEKAPFIDPEIERERREKLNALDDSFVVAKVQIGTFYLPPKALPRDPRAFSVEWEQDLMQKSMARLYFEYDYRQLRIQIGDSAKEFTRYSVVVKFDRIRKLAIGWDFGNPYICFDLLTPPIFQREDIYRPEDRNFERGYRHRVGSLQPGHAAVSPYAHHLRIVLFNDSSYYGGDVLDKFYNFCDTAGLQPPIRDVKIDARREKFFEYGKLFKVAQWLRELNSNWRVAFQIEALLRNGIANTIEVLQLRPRIDDLIRRHGKIAAEVMRYFVEAAGNRPLAQPLEKCYEIVLQKKLLRPRLTTQGGRFFCHHVTFTPTRLLLEGPNVSQSNRVIRSFEGYEDFFLRVDFRDEDHLQYRWERDVDGISYLQERVGTVLKQGFDLAGRHFDFLAYSQSALRSHAVWYVSPFRHPEKGLVTAETIRASLGNFEEVIYSPSKYGARMAQAFTATDPSVKIHRDQWCDMEDIEENGILFTDGIGTISQGLSNMIWDALCRNYSDHGRNSVQPTAVCYMENTAHVELTASFACAIVVHPYLQYQIRFLGYKGVVSVDTQLEGIRMCLRPSMKKFSVPEQDYADIEIASAFGRPMVPHLNRCCRYLWCRQSLPNSLGGGDLDGDIYEVIQHGPLLVPEHHDPASYPTAKPFKLDRESTIVDVCDFIVEYINSDVVGLVSDKHITIAVLIHSSILRLFQDGVLDPACLKLAELHSKAVDYPKNGNKVDIVDMPRQLIPFKPDWHQIEQSTHRAVGYYESSRALGHMYRNIILEEIPDNPPNAELLNDPITKALQSHVRRQLGHLHHTDQGWIEPIYAGYREELTYISTTYSFSRTPLREEELVVGVILANCPDERYKKDRQYSMRESLSFLLNSTRLGIVGEVNETTSDEELRQKLARGWHTWTYSLQKALNQVPFERFGSRSFGLIALGLVLDCLVRLSGLPPLQ